MSLFDRNTTRRWSHVGAILLLSCPAIGCASGQGRSFNEFRPTPAPTQSVPTPAPAFTPGTPSSQPSQSGPVILPRDSFRRPPGRQQAEYGQRRSHGYATPPRITPRNIPSPIASPLASPLIRHTPQPAELVGEIEIVPRSHIADSTSQRSYFDIVPKEPATLDPHGVELLSAPISDRYEELPPPPE